MIEKSDRKEGERRLEQAMRAAALGNDPVTAELRQPDRADRPNVGTWTAPGGCS
jgi:hypothetical protein